MSKGQAEAKIREEFIRIFKKFVGKGPRTVMVRIVHKFVLVHMEDILTVVERNVLNADGGEEQIATMRQKVVTPAIEEYSQVLRDLFGTEVSDVLHKSDYGLDERYYLFVMKEDVEKDLN